jgi:hypothetical protein
MGMLKMAFELVLPRALAAGSLDCFLAVGGRWQSRPPSPRHHAEFLGGVLKQHLNLIKTISIDVA